jgi:trk system potassium uptake protein TrkA
LPKILKKKENDDMRTIISGNNHLVKYLAQQYISKGYYVSIIERDPVKARILSKETNAVIHLGDITDPACLEDAEAESTDLLICITSKDYINFAACQTGKTLFNIPSVFALVNKPANYDVFKDAGITGVFNQSDLLLQEVYKTDDNQISRNLFSYTGNLIQVIELTIKAGMPADGIEIVALGLSRETNIVSIVRNGRVEFPDKNFILNNGDKLILAVTPDTLANSVHLICGNQA